MKNKSHPGGFKYGPFHNSRLRIESRICWSISSTTLSSCKDIDAIALYLLTEKRPQVLMISYQIDTTAEKLLQVLGGFDVII